MVDLLPQIMCCSHDWETNVPYRKLDNMTEKLTENNFECVPYERFLLVSMKFKAVYWSVKFQTDQQKNLHVAFI